MSHLMLDTRLLRVSRYILGQPEDLMQLAEEVTRGAFYVCEQHGASLHICGTGFLIAFLNTPLDEMGSYVVTAAHVIEGIKRRQKKDVWLLMNSIDGGRTPIRVPLKEWWFHPTDRAVDVAVADWGVFRTSEERSAIDHTILLAEMAVMPPDHHTYGIREGSEIFMTGVFSLHSGRKRVIPILRAGNIALMPNADEPIKTKRGWLEAYLVECRSIGGLSGSPAFCAIDKILPPIIPPTGSIPIEDYKAEIRALWAWIGVVQGHWDIKQNELDSVKTGNEEALNTGIAVIVPAWKVLEVLNQSKLLEMRKESIRKRMASDTPTEDETRESPTQRTNAPKKDEQIKIPVPSRGQFVRDLKKATRKQAPSE